jgi:hypothetical protein
MKLIVSANPLSGQLAALDWSAPWWQPWRDIGQQVAQQVIAGARVCDALNAQQARKPAQYLPAHNLPPSTLHPAPSQPVQFVPQSALPEGQAYEAFIFASGQVPTRENLHDFFNGLAWLVFPHTKRRLNSLQNSVLAACGVQSTRGALRDALTLFDENAALWLLPAPPAASPPPDAVSPDAAASLLAALQAKQWQRAFVTLRSHWPQHQPVLFGHALLEKLVSPYKSITAHVYRAQAAPENVANADHTTRSTSPHIRSLDHQIAQHLSPASLVPKPFIPLPVLGVPGWWAANADAQFYADAQVFRPPPPVANAANP